MKKFCAFLFLFSVIFISYSQTDYSDVAVIMNTNSEESVEIGTYFAEQRSVPEENLIYVDCLDEEIVDTTEFKSIVNQVRTYLDENNLAGSINYLVTTRGIPVNISYSDVCFDSTGIHCKSLDNKLTLLNSSLTWDLYANNTILNPYFESEENFSQQAYDFYLVTRLDGLVVDSVFAMIDKTGPNRPVVKEEANILIDFFHPDTVLPFFATQRFEPAIDFLLGNNWNVSFDPDTNLITQMDNLLIYAGLIRDTNLTAPDYKWIDGSMLMSLLPNSNYSFYYNGNEIDYSLMKLMNSGGSTGTAYVNPYYWSSNSYDPFQIYSKYLNDTSEMRYNLAESLYSGMRILSGQQVVIGDPKTSLDIVYAGLTEAEYMSADIRIYPNPGRGIFYLSFNRNLEVKNIRVYNQFGQRIKEFAPGREIDNDIRLDLQDLRSGIYFLKVIPVAGAAITHKLIIR
ncbi:MAG: TIGR03790 family protein [Bacteroidota bacterium]|nr:TIGR03790 family protein [Bacteroidota bacterium]